MTIHENDFGGSDDVIQVLVVYQETKRDLLRQQWHTHKRISAFFTVYHCLTHSASSFQAQQKEKYKIRLFDWLWDHLETQIVWLEQLRIDFDQVQNRFFYLFRDLSDKELKSVKENQNYQRMTEDIGSLLARLQQYNRKLRERLARLQKDNVFLKYFKEGYYYHAVLELRDRLGKN